VDRAVRGTVEEALNALVDAEADRLCNARRYERSRLEGLASQLRHLERHAAGLRLQVPPIIECYGRQEASVEEARIEMYLAGIPVRPVEDIT